MTTAIDDYHCVFVGDPALLRPNAIYKDKYEAVNWYRRACFDGPILTYSEWLALYKGVDN